MKREDGKIKHIQKYICVSNGGLETKVAGSYNNLCK